LSATAPTLTNKVMAVLTPEQRKQAREYGPWWATEEE